MPLSRLLSAILCSACLLALSPTAGADTRIYLYTDANGVQHLTNMPRGDNRYKLYMVWKDLKPRSAALASPTPLLPKGERARSRAALQPLILKYSRMYGFDERLVEAVIEVESGYDHRAVSPVGAQGLMQIMPATARDLGLGEPFDPEQNIEAGVRYLRAMYDRFGRIRLALAAYNCGPQPVERHLDVPPIAETQYYVEAVLSRFRQKRGI